MDIYEIQKEIRTKRLSKLWLLRKMAYGALLIALICLITLSGTYEGDTENFFAVIGLTYRRCGSNDGAFAFYNVNNADASCIYTNRVVGLIDTGLVRTGIFLSHKIGELKTDTLDFVVISHPHRDHIGGYSYLLSQFKVKRLYILPYSETQLEEYYLYEELIEESLAKGVEVNYVSHGMNITIDDVHLQFYDYTTGADEENQRSLVVMATLRNQKCLYMGDAGDHIEEQILRLKVNVDADILKVGHHGSKAASSSEFLSVVSPDYSVVCVGKNQYGHPSAETAKRLEEAGSILYRTDICDGVVFNVKDGKIHVKVLID